MPGNHPNLFTLPTHSRPDQSGYYRQHDHLLSAFFDGKFGPLPNVDIRTSDICPKTFVIFDQTHDRRQIMFHPELSSKLFHPGFDVGTSVFQGNFDTENSKNEGDKMFPLKEDSDDIDALLSTEYEDFDDDDDDMVSTARTEAIYGPNSPDSCSNYESLSKKSRPCFLRSSGSHCNEKKRHKTRRMVNALKGIVPGANRMSTIAVLDEAVRYLKSLRVEVQKLEIGNSKG